MSGNRSILVLYRVVNSDSDGCTPMYNCFRMPYGSGPTLTVVKRYVYFSKDNVVAFGIGFQRSRVVLIPHVCLFLNKNKKQYLHN
jgi:hypothetical protein